MAPDGDWSHTTQFFILSSITKERRCTGSPIGSGKSSIRTTLNTTTKHIYVLFNDAVTCYDCT
jgi:hypothetical protein